MRPAHAKATQRQQILATHTPQPGNRNTGFL